MAPAAVVDTMDVGDTSVRILPFPLRFRFLCLYVFSSCLPRCLRACLGGFFAQCAVLGLS